MSQEARIEAARRATIQRLKGGYDSDVLTQDDDEDIPLNRLVCGLSDAVTDVTTTPAYVGGIREGRLRAHAATFITRGATARGPMILRETMEAHVFGGDHLECSGEMVNAYYAMWGYPNTSIQTGLLNNVLIPINHGGAFFQLEELRNEVSGIESLIASTRFIAWRYADQLASRLNDLLDETKEENPQGPWISTASLRKFCEFLEANPHLAYPQLGLTPNGNIYSRWRVDRQRLFSAQFLENGDVSFVIFKPNLKHVDKTVRVSGLTTVDALIDEVQNHGIANWVLE